MFDLWLIIYSYIRKHISIIYVCMYICKSIYCSGTLKWVTQLLHCGPMMGFGIVTVSSLFMVRRIIEYFTGSNKFPKFAIGCMLFVKNNTSISDFFRL